MAPFSVAHFIKETRRRPVFSVVVLYVVGAWIVLQAADLAFPGLGIPESAIRYVWIGAILGLPVAVVFGWRFDITIQGIRRTPTVPDETTALSLRTPDYILLFVLSTATIAMVFLLTQKIVGTQGTIEPVVSEAELHEFDPPEYSIAVLPFDNLSSDPEQEYFVAGMHDALIAELARIGNLMVISRRSTLHYKETKLTVPEIARELNVAMIVEGSVFKSGDQIRIQIQLVGSQPERHLLAQTYDRELSGVLELQAEVTKDIAEKIKVNLTPQEQSRLADARTVDSETYTLWLKGNFHLARLNEESFGSALASYQEAIDRDPNYAPAYAGLAMAYNGLGSWHASGSHAYARLATKAAERALALDPTLAEAYLALGHIRRLYEWDWAGAERAFKQGMALNPSATPGRIEYANFLTSMGRFEESIEIGRQTLLLDPLSPAVHNELGWALEFSGRDDEALELYRDGRGVDPDCRQSHWILSDFYLKRGEFERAIAYLEPLPLDRVMEMPSFYMGLFGHLLGLVGRQTDARAILAELMQRRAQEYIPASALADIY
ncbi:MAG: tetratricopeptide repeat protein, partial [Proteobacteria bacterium]|nr:tetratricopeptide repeat protein [Pseudomonadota bacterium]